MEDGDKHISADQRCRKKTTIVRGLDEDAALASILKIAESMMKRRDAGNGRNKYTQAYNRKFREFFGCSPVVAATIWRRVQIDDTENAPLVQGGTIQHMMWALHLMKKYGPYGVMAKICVADEKTIHKQSWPFISAIAELDGQLVSFLQISVAFICLQLTVTPPA